ncbi:MAG: oligopeptide/dipeptide ABC transporter ATP-binding protein [Oscillospiraceae bacterium]|nr:oligopeptide/dipeptide ABC transporter ATP-binding protein [Oscillospiraceae bacterium]
MEPLIRTVDLKKYFKTADGYLHAVDGINISIQRGETIGVVGESGCGKSTLGRLLIRLLEPTDGQIFFNGADIVRYSKKETRSFRKNAQIIFQDPYSSLNPRLTVSEIIAEPIIVNRMLKKPDEINQRVFQMMDKVGLAARLVNAYPHELDGGRRQRIGIARALALDPEFIVCDEPVSALDVSIQAQIINLLMDLQDEDGLTYMFITHDLSVVKHISDHIAVMYLGVCVEKAPAKQLFQKPMHPYTKALLKAIPKASITSRNQKIEVLRGEVTSPINMKAGCRFQARCPFAKEDCGGSEIPLVEVEPNHFVSCKYVGEINA